VVGWGRRGGCWQRIGVAQRLGDRRQPVCEDVGPTLLSSEVRIIMSDQTRLPGELLYEYNLKITQLVEYGVSMESLTSGQVPPPAEGAL
jgi:hypothetical protein